MFSRRPDRPKEEPRRAPSLRPSELVPVPPSDQRPGVWGSAPVEAGAGGGVAPARRAREAPVVAARDHVEGALRSGQGVLVLGSFSGSIASETWVRMGEGSRVQADVTADEVVVAGRYEGRLVARSRLEIAATGHVLGDIEAPRLQLHEGGVIDGTLSMTTHAADRRTAEAQPATPGSAARSASVRAAGGQGVSPRSRGATAVPVEAPPPGLPAEMPAGPVVPDPAIASTPRP